MGNMAVYSIYFTRGAHPMGALVTKVFHTPGYSYPYLGDIDFLACGWVDVGGVATLPVPDDRTPDCGCAVVGDNVHTPTQRSGPRVLTVPLKGSGYSDVWIRV